MLALCRIALRSFERPVVPAAGAGGGTRLPGMPLMTKVLSVTSVSASFTYPVMGAAATATPPDMTSDGLACAAAPPVAGAPTACEQASFKPQQWSKRITLRLPLAAQM